MIGDDGEQVGRADRARGAGAGAVARVSIWSRFRRRRDRRCAGSWTTGSSSTNRTAGRARPRRSSTRCSSRKSRCVPRSTTTTTTSRWTTRAQFLAERDKVKFTVTFRGREMAHQEIGHKLIQRIIAELADVATVETPARAGGPHADDGADAEAAQGRRRRPRPKRRAGDGRSQRDRLTYAARDRREEKHPMPKMKTNRAAAKRFKLTGTGKVMRRSLRQAPRHDRQARDSQAPAARHDAGRPTPTRPACCACSASASSHDPRSPNPAGAARHGESPRDRRS